MFYKGWYHFFYQYNPNAAVWGDIVWGHAVSRDLIHWVHLPIAMVADQWYDSNGVWTGSATFLPDGSIVMLYTGSTDKAVQVCTPKLFLLALNFKLLEQDNKIVETVFIRKN